MEAKLGDYPSQSLVWRAIHIDLKKAVAVKIFSVPFGGTRESRRRLVREWNQLKRLQHPAIARCYGGGFDEADAYLAYELVEGETLAMVLERRPRLAWDAVLDFALPLTEGLIHAHDASICHGAIVPEKIIVTGLSAVLLDIRTDRVHSVYRNPRPVQPLEVALRAPEVVADPTAISPRGDIYALGAVMYLALTGRPPISGETVDEVARNVATAVPPKPAEIALDCPVWISSLVHQMLAKEPEQRQLDCRALLLAMREAQRRSSQLTGVAEHASSGFSPLQVTPQSDKDEARKLLGRELIDLDPPEPAEASEWYEKTSVLAAVLLLLLAGLAWLVWPLNESQMRQRAERLLADDSRSSLQQAKNAYLIPMLNRFPEGEHADWAADQIDQIEMRQAESALRVKLRRNLPLRDEGERLYADAWRFEQFGDWATALDKYRSLETLLQDQPKYKPFVGLARRQIAAIRGRAEEADEAQQILEAKLNEADQLYDTGRVVAAKNIWLSIVELYENHSDVAPLVRTAQQRLASTDHAAASRD